jgi:(+)-pinoresinol hydroxylase
MNVRFIAAMLICAATPVLSADAVAPTSGKALFDRWCAECHAPGHGYPGTQQLGRAKGEKMAVLEQRQDLNAGLIRYVVRNGQVAMSAYRPSEISDAELDQIAAYLAPPKKRKR